MSLPTVLVIGGTGTQGGSVAHALLTSGKFSVRALVRDNSSPASQALKSQGAILIQGDWDDIPAIQEAVAGCTGLFLNSYPSFTNLNAESRQGLNILTASKAAGVKHVIYSSVLGVDCYEHLIVPNPDPESFLGAYFRNKRTIHEAVESSGWENWTILRGATFMTNFLLPSAAFQFPELGSDGILLTSYTPETKVYCFNPEDFGKFVLAALSNPGKYSGRAINLAVECLGMDEMARLMGRVSGKKVIARFRTDKEVESQRGVNHISDSQAAFRKVNMDVEQTKAWGVPMLTFEEFLVKYKDILIHTLG